MRICVLFVLVFVSLSSFSKTLFISDIDDTIKISHVLDTRQAIGNALRIDNHFYGMSQLYSSYSKVDSSAHFIYVSAAKKNVMWGLHRNFLRLNGFVPGDVILREKLSTEEFKLATIRNLVKTHKPNRLILVGDNAEKDPYVYEKIKNEFSEIETLIFIHQVYSYRSKSDVGVEPQIGQILFVTAIDLAREFLVANLVDTDSYEALIQEIGPVIVRQSLNRHKGAVAFPSWIDCTDYIEWAGLDRVVIASSGVRKNAVWAWPWQRKDKTSDILLQYDEKLKARCLGASRVKVLPDEGASESDDDLS